MRWAPKKVFSGLNQARNLFDRVKFLFFYRDCIAQLKTFTIFALQLLNEIIEFYFLSESSSVGRAQPCQGWGREFESRLPLKNSSIVKSFF
jgi:hypothetical protein